MLIHGMAHGMQTDLIRIVRNDGDPQTRVLIFRPDGRGRIRVLISLGRLTIREPPVSLFRETSPDCVAVVIDVKNTRFSHAVTDALSRGEGLAPPTSRQRERISDESQGWWMIGTVSSARRVYDVARSRVEQMVTRSHLECRWDSPTVLPVQYDPVARMWTRGRTTWTQNPELPGAASFAHM